MDKQFFIEREGVSNIADTPSNYFIEMISILIFFEYDSCIMASEAEGV